MRGVLIQPSPHSPLPSRERGRGEGVICVLLLLLLATTGVAAPAGNFATFLGGSGADEIADVAIDQQGNIYLAGQTGSTNFPTVNALQPDHAASDDFFIAKFNPAGDTLLFATYFGGNGTDQATGITLDLDGNIWVCGWTTSTDMLTVAPLQDFNAGEEDAFLLCLSSAGDTLRYASYLGGYANDRALDIATDSSGNLYFVGSTSSGDFPAANAMYYDLNGTESDAFIGRIELPSFTLRFATYFGGTGADVATGIVTDNSGSLYVCGFTNSTDLPLVGPSQDTLAGGYDLWVAKFDSLAATLVGSTYCGGKADDIVRGVTISSSGEVILVGTTYSDDYPLHLPLAAICLFCPYESEGFITSFDQMTGEVRFSSYFGGYAGDEAIEDVVVDAASNLILVGWTSSSYFPLFEPLQSGFGGVRDAFVAIVNPNRDSVRFSTFYGDVNTDQARALAVGEGRIVIAGKTGSPDFPLLNPWQVNYGGVMDGFVLRLDHDADTRLCGDYDGSRDIDIADAVYLVQYIFSSGGALQDGHNGDVDCDGEPTIADAAYLVNFIFTHGAAPCALCK